MCWGGRSSRTRNPSFNQASRPSRQEPLIPGSLKSSRGFSNAPPRPRFLEDEWRKLESREPAGQPSSVALQITCRWVPPKFYHWPVREKITSEHLFPSYSSLLYSPSSPTPHFFFLITTSYFTMGFTDFVSEAGLSSMSSTAFFSPLFSH